MSTELDLMLTSLEFSRRFTNSMLDAIPADKLCYQPFPGANHALWVMGHIASADAFLMQIAGGPSDPSFERLNSQFFMKSVPQPNLDAYPPVAEVRGWYDGIRNTLIEWYRSQSSAELALPLPEQYQRVASNRLNLITRIAIHEAAHAGQLTVIRKALGLDPVFA